MTINSEQIQALAARLQLKANEAKQSDDWGCDSNNFHDVATPDNILSLLAERDADKALIAELKPIAAHAQRGWREAHEQEALVEQAMTRIAEQAKRIAELETSHKNLRESMAAIHNTIQSGGAYTPLAAILNASKRAYEESAAAAGITLVVEE
ncbi:hypothetical protein ACRARH_03855 [Phytobacter ursingii]